MNSEYKNYLVAVLMAILALTYADRMVFGVVQEDIRIGLGLTDTELGILSGIAFTLFYSIMGLPIARWADRGNRITIVSITAVIWSVSVAGCAMAASFLQLLLVRIGIAAGEAGCQPPAHSLIPDYFSRAERARATARYMLGVPLGLMVGYFAGGWLNQLVGWRMTFVIVAVPGLVLGALAFFTLEEPRRQARAQPGRSSGTATQERAAEVGFKEVIVTLWFNATFRHLLAAFLVWYLCGWALMQWQPTFFIRSHGVSTGELGMWLAVVHGGARLVGTWLGGEWAARYAAHDEKLQLRGTVVLFVLFAIFNATALLAPNRYWSFAMLALGALGEGAAFGPLFGTFQTLVPARMRATALALISLFPAFIGNGFGPLAAGALSDAFRDWAGVQSLRYALLVFCPGYAWAAWHFWCASRTVTRDVVAVQANAGAEAGSQCSSLAPGGDDDSGHTAHGSLGGTAHRR